MPIIDRPWTRVRTPVPIPDPITIEAIAGLPPADFANLLRSNFVPRADLPDGRRRWEQLWQILKRDDGLAERTLDMLEDFLDTTKAALAAGGLDEAEAVRATKFTARCDEAWQRVDKPLDQPLAWAGSAGNFQPKAQRVIAKLVAAIARHRSETTRTGDDRAADTALWDVLRDVGLDPQDYQSRR